MNAQGIKCIVISSLFFHFIMTPSLVYDYRDQKYKVLIQNRVNMDDTVYIPSRDFFLTSDEDNIRPYGLLFKEIKK